MQQILYIVAACMQYTSLIVVPLFCIFLLTARTKNIWFWLWLLFEKNREEEHA